MNILRHVAQLVLNVNKVQSEAAVKLYDKLGLCRKFFTACGIPCEIAARLEARFLAEARRSVDEQHDLASRWVRGDMGIAQFAEDYMKWYSVLVERCDDITAEELYATA